MTRLLYRRPLTDVDRQKDGQASDPLTERTKADAQTGTYDIHCIHDRIATLVERLFSCLASITYTQRQKRWKDRQGGGQVNSKDMKTRDGDTVIQ